jgi:hypothetical protein
MVDWYRGMEDHEIVGEAATNDIIGAPDPIDVFVNAMRDMIPRCQRVICIWEKSPNEVVNLALE